MSQQPPENKHSMEQAGASDESIQKVHSILIREKPEPSEGYKPMPLFLLGFISTMIFICSIYLVHYRGGFDPLVYDERFDPATAAGAGGPVELTPEQLLALGKKQYNTCATCHQPTGAGLPGVYPPLAGSEWVLENEDRLIRILLDGMTGPIQVKGNTYNGAMPAFGAAGYKWNDEKIAAVLTYIRQEWGNAAEPISAAKVKEIREADGRTKPWTAEELESVQ
ncbi:MAG: cytochrome c [Verrucomicrobiota bacterium]